MTKQPRKLALTGEGPNDIGDLIGYLRSCSDPMLEQFEMSRLGISANLIKDLKRTMEEAINSATEALLARTLREQRQALANDGAQPSYSRELVGEIFTELAAVLPEAPEPKRRKKALGDEATDK